MRSPKKPSWFGAAGLAVLSLAALPTAVYAFDARIEKDVKHVIECLTWMVNDPPRYVENCTPSRPREVMEAPINNKRAPSSSQPNSSSEPPPPGPSSSSEPPPSSSSEPPPSSSEPPPSSSEPPPSSSYSEPEEPSCEELEECPPPSCEFYSCQPPA
ncbi:MAG: hypothetical protein JNL14_09585 [Devosia sp.]|uniref:hypothetical protein n=1 Tax=Devosia sp. TaxID=1871048 RepID=UPI001A436ABE|nr:hypothetical protein [Devosia sp.]MBL8597974.1 hypothetical protein [Devosia sp.]